MFNNFRLKRVTYNLGKAVETENDITCAVDNNKLISIEINNNEINTILEEVRDTTRGQVDLLKTVEQLKINRIATAKIIGITPPGLSLNGINVFTPP